MTSSREFKSKRLFQSGLQTKGFTFAEVLVASAVLAIVSLGIASSLVMISKQSSDVLNRSQIKVISTNLRSAMSDPEALSRNVMDSGNSVFDCVQGSSDTWNADSRSRIISNCKDVKGSLQTILNRTGSSVWNGSDSKAGFLADGSSCNTYGVDGDVACIYRPDVKVSFVCSNSDCKSLDLVLEVSLKTKDPITGDESSKFLFTVRRSLDALSGNWLQTNKIPPQSDIGSNETFKLLVIVDNSTSMLAYQQKLADNVDQMLNKLKGLDFSIAVEVVSTTQYITYGGATLASNIYQMLNVSFSCDGTPGTCQGLKKYGTQTENFVMKPPPKATLAYGASEAEFATFAASVKKAILESGTAGSDVEQPLCTLARILNGESSFFASGDHAGVLIISNENDNSTTATCARQITRNYIAGYTAWAASPVHSGAVVIPPAATQYQDYLIKKTQGGAGYHVSARCEARRDGSFVTYDSTNPTTYSGLSLFINDQVSGSTLSATSLANWGIDITQTCASSGLNFTGNLAFPNRYGLTPSSPYLDCPANVIEKLQAINASANNCAKLADSSLNTKGRVAPGTCKIYCSPDLNWVAHRPKLPGKSENLFQYENLSESLCNTPFSYDNPSPYLVNGVEAFRIRKIKPLEAGNPNSTAQGLIDIVLGQGVSVWTDSNGSTASSCFRIPTYQQPAAVGSSVTYQSVLKDTTYAALEIEPAIKSLATDLFGKGGFFMSAIIHTTGNTTCSMQANESVGTKIETLFDSITKKTTLPICSQDYAPALEPLRQFISQAYENSAFLELGPTEFLATVYVSRQGVNTRLSLSGESAVKVRQFKRMQNGNIKYILDFSNTEWTLDDSDQIWILTQKRFVIDKLDSN